MRLGLGREVDRAAEDIEQAAILLDASQGVAVLVQALRILASQIGDLCDSDRSQVSSDAWTHARNSLKLISVSFLAHRISSSLKAGC